MFDFHLHSTVSFDGHSPAREMAEAASCRGLCEICFTDHIDYTENRDDPIYFFDLEDYSRAYDALEIPGLKIRRGVEFGLTPQNMAQADLFLSRRKFDFVIGSVHEADGYDPYDAQYWQERSTAEAFRSYLERSLECAKRHRNFDVWGHLNYVCKSPNNPTHEPLRYEDYREICDEIMKILAENGKGLEINTSGCDRVGEFLPNVEFLRRFRELGGEIVTVGSDAHHVDRVGQYTSEALELLREVFGYVCTFENRKPIFHKL